MKKKFELTVWDYLDIAVEREPALKDRVDHIRGMQEPERTEKANEALTALWASLAQE